MTNHWFSRFILMLSLLLIIGLTACGDESDAQSDDRAGNSSVANVEMSGSLDDTSEDEGSLQTAVNPSPTARSADTTHNPTPQPPLNTPIPQPPPPAAATRLPRTDDPNLDDWTLLIYLDGDNNLEQPSLWDMNEMEAAGNSDRVNVLVQLDRIPGEADSEGDWTDTRRYEIVGDNDLYQITSPVVMEMGEVNMGDPDELADFLIWGIDNYPANHYALVIWNHGSGWLGIAFDDSTPDGDGLTLPDLDAALLQALTETNLDKLDIIGFDACLMGQVDVYQGMAAYADYSVGSEELVPGYGWDYEAILRNLYADSSMDGGRWAEYMVSDYINYYTKINPDDQVTMSAVDLNQFSQLSTSMEILATALQANPAAVVSAVGDARGGAEGYALVYPEDAEYYAAIDLWHFASILAQRSTDTAVTAAAQNVMQAIDSVVIAADHGSGFDQAHGVSVYFPRTSDFFFSDRYLNETPLPYWNNFLSSYYDGGLVNIAPAELQIVDVLSDQGGVQNPIYMDMQINGNDIENVLLVGGRYQSGQQQLLTYDNLIPEPTQLNDGTLLYEWQDGTHEDFFIWQTESTFLTDGSNGDFAVIWPTDYDSPLYTVRGLYRRAGTNEQFDANLVFDTELQQLRAVWTFSGKSGSAPNEIFPNPGDQFQIYDIYVTESDDLAFEPGVELTFDANGLVYYEWRALPSGDYFLGFVASTIDGQTASDFRDFSVNNDNLIANSLAYLDPYRGFQFLYPESWYRPTYDENGLLFTYDIADESTFFNLTLYPNVGTNTTESLMLETMNAFGNPEIIFETPIDIGNESGQAIVYGYEGSDSSHTGILMTFIHDGVGYVVDLDGPAVDEEYNVDAIETMIDSWVFLPVSFGAPPQSSLPDSPVISQPPPVANEYVETFDAVGDWGVGSSEALVATVTGGVFEFTVLAESGVYWTVAEQSFSNGVYEVEATQIGGPLDNGYGMLLRANSETGAFYLFEISGDGYIWIGRCADSCNQADPLVKGGWFQSEAVNQGLNATNFLRVVADGPNMTFYVNGFEVGRITDTALSGGDVGLMVETLGEGGVEVVFDNFLFTPSQGK